MSIFPTRPQNRLLPDAGESPLQRTTTPFDWARRRRVDRDVRRMEAAGARAIDQLQHLGPAWHVVAWPHVKPLAEQFTPFDQPGAADRTGFLAIGPGGVFAVTVVDHGRSRVMIAGDVVQIDGRRPPYVADAVRDAKRAGKAISAAVGLQVPVTPALTFVGAGVITFYGLPKGCLVAPHQNLDRLLVAGGNRISAATAQKLSRVAERPTTWQPDGQPSTYDYGWYAQGRTAADKRPSPR